MLVPLLPHRVPWVLCPKRSSSHPSPDLAEPMQCPTSCPALAAVGKASPEIF